MKDTNFNVNEYLPLRDVVFNTLARQLLLVNLHRENVSGNFSCQPPRCKPYSCKRSYS